MRTLKRWTERRPPRRLQISEVCDEVRDFLDAKAVPGLRSRYLPTGVKIRVSEEDYRSLRPFQRELAEAVAAIAAGVAERPGRQLLRGEPRVLLEAAPELAEGAPPKLIAGFPRARGRTLWRSPEPTAEADDRENVTELVFTFGSEAETSLQEAHRLHLGGAAPSEPASEVHVDDPRPPGACGRKRAGGAPSLTAALVRDARDRRRLVAPGGAVVIGRNPRRCHIAPVGAPATVSGRHLLLARTDDGGLSVMDLASSNGTWIDDRVCPPFQPRRLELPAVLSLGRSGSARVRIRETPLEEPDDRSPMTATPTAAGIPCGRPA